MMNELLNPEQMAVYDLPGGDGTLAVRMAQAELNQHIVTARQYPRSVARAMRQMLDLVNLDRQTAEECIYALPRSGKPIRGPSVRFAEIVAAAWGNCHVGSRVVAVDLTDKVVVAEGVFWDLESGLKRVSQVRRRITDKSGKLFSDDMIVVTGNAACSIAMREAILRGVPKAIWRTAYDAAEAAIAGSVMTIVQRREEALKAFAMLGVKPELIYETLEVDGIEDIGSDELATLRAMLVSIRNQEATVESYFPGLAGGKGKPEAARAKGEAAPSRQEPRQRRSRSETTLQEEGAPQGDAPEAEAHLRAAYDAILADAMDAGAAKAREANAAIIETMRTAAPEMFERLNEELAAFDEAEGR